MPASPVRALGPRMTSTAGSGVWVGRALDPGSTDWPRDHSMYRQPGLVGRDSGTERPSQRRAAKNSSSSAPHSSASTPPRHRQLVVEPGVGAQLVERPARPGLGVGRAEDEASHPGGHEGPGAHRAGLECHHQGDVAEPPGPEGGRRVAQRQDLGVGGGVEAQLPLVVAGGDDPAVDDGDGTDGDVAVGDGLAWPRPGPDAWRPGRRAGVRVRSVRRQPWTGAR